MSKMRISIIGMGQIGGSLGKALKSLKNRYYIIGVDKDKKTLKAALQTGAADEVSQDLKSVKGSAIAVICLPVDLIALVFAQLLKVVDSNTIITDAGSVKEKIEKQIEECRVKSGDKGKILKQVQDDGAGFGLLRQGFAFPRNDRQKMPSRGAKPRGSLLNPAAGSILRASPSALSFVPAHPMAGREKNGIKSADAKMFENANLVITGSAETAAGKKVAQMWKDAGAKIIKMQAKKHDFLAALTSHLPHIIAFSLNKIYKETKKKNPEADLLTAGSFKSMTRVSVSSADMWAPIFASNAENVGKHLKAFIKELQIFEKSLNNQSKLKKEILRTQK